MGNAATTPLVVILSLYLSPSLSKPFPSPLTFLQQQQQPFSSRSKSRVLFARDPRVLHVIIMSTGSKLSDIRKTMNLVSKPLTWITLESCEY